VSLTARLEGCIDFIVDILKSQLGGDAFGVRVCGSALQLLAVYTKSSGEFNSRFTQHVHSLSPSASLSLPFPSLPLPPHP
jgi:hypothetical protein